MFNLRAVGDKIKLPIIKVYDKLLNRIAIKSKAYKRLQNRIQLYKDLNQCDERFYNYIKYSPMLKLTAHLHREFSIQMHSKFDIIAIRQTTINDWIICSNDLEKLRIIKEMAQFSGAGKVFTVKEFLKMTYLPAKPEAIYILSTVYIKDYTQIVNLLYMHNLERAVL